MSRLVEIRSVLRVCLQLHCAPCPIIALTLVSTLPPFSHSHVPSPTAYQVSYGHLCMLCILRTCMGTELGFCCDEPCPAFTLAHSPLVVYVDPANSQGIPPPRDRNLHWIRNVHYRHSPPSHLPLHLLRLTLFTFSFYLLVLSFSSIPPSRSLPLTSGKPPHLSLPLPFPPFGRVSYLTPHTPHTTLHISRLPQHDPPPKTTHLGIKLDTSNPNFAPPINRCGRSSPRWRWKRSAAHGDVVVDRVSGSCRVVGGRKSTSDGCCRFDGTGTDTRTGALKPDADAGKEREKVGEQGGRCKGKMRYSLFVCRRECVDRVLFARFASW